MRSITEYIQPNIFPRGLRQYYIQTPKQGEWLICAETKTMVKGVPEKEILLKLAKEEVGHQGKDFRASVEITDTTNGIVRVNAEGYNSLLVILRHNGLVLNGAPTK